MTRPEKIAKREKAYFKLTNQIGILSRTATKKDQPIVAELDALAQRLSIGQ